MENQIQVFTHEQTFEHDQFGALRTRYDDHGNIEINLEDASRGLGFVQVKFDRVPTSGDSPYTAVRWERVKQYLADTGYEGEISKDAYIPESVFYMLAMKANNEAAKKFQRWIAFEVIPSIRKHGGYVTPAKAAEILKDPDAIMTICANWKKALEKVAELEDAVAVQAQQIAELQPKGAFYDMLLSCKGAWAVGVIAKDYGMKAPEFNQLLREMGLQYQQGAPGKKYWLLTKKALDMQEPDECWTMTEARIFQDRNGEQRLGRPFMRWTHQGRIALYRLLKERGILPQSEKPHTESDTAENN